MRKGITVNLQEYLKQDRQWPRQLRMDHATYQLNIAKGHGDHEMVSFWENVFQANKRVPLEVR